MARQKLRLKIRRGLIWYWITPDGQETTDIKLAMEYDTALAARQSCHVLLEQPGVDAAELEIFTP